MSREERWAFWQKELSRCVKCYACRNSCPMCYCEHCTMDCNRPQWVPVASHALGNLEYHMVRAMHLAGRCVECGDCGRACPVGIPVHLLTFFAEESVHATVRPAGGAHARSWTTRCPPSGPTTKRPSSGRSPWQTPTNSPTNALDSLFAALRQGRPAHPRPRRRGRPHRAERGRRPAAGGQGLPPDHPVRQGRRSSPRWSACCRYTIGAGPGGPEGRRAQGRAHRAVRRSAPARRRPSRPWTPSSTGTTGTSSSTRAWRSWPSSA